MCDGDDKKQQQIQKSMSFVGTIDVGVALRPDTRLSDVRPWWQQLVVPALFGFAMGVIVSARKPWLFTVAGLVLLVVGGPQFISSTFTLWNWTMLLGQIADRALRRRAVPRLLPFLLVNSWAIFTSFNAMALFHRQHFAELAKRLDYSMARFHGMNTLGHFAPPVLATAWFSSLPASDRRAACEWTDVVPLPVASLSFHLLWAIRVQGGLRLDNVYLKRPKHHWYTAWAIAAVTHVGVGVVLSRDCGSVNYFERFFSSP